MAISALVQDGQIVESASQSSLKKAQESSSNGMDKDAFLQLLVAEMQYQDPLEPTSNTEYISQYAQFSQVESLSNMAGSMELTRASSLVGQEVYIKTTDSKGESSFVQGKVDYVAYENGKAYLAIDEKLYSLDDLDTVVDTDYMKAYNGALTFDIEMNKLPSFANITISADGARIDSLNESYSAMSDYEKKFITNDTVSTLKKYTEKLEQLRAEALTKDEAAEDETKVDETEEAGE